MRQRAPRRNVQFSYADVAAYSAMVGFGETYFGAFALAIGLSQVAAGLLGTVPLLVAGILQLAAPAGPRLCGSYRRWVVACVTLQGLTFVPLAIACARGTMSPLAVYGVATLYYLTGMAAGSAWSTWIDGIIPRRVFGGFLAKRARLTQLAAFIAFLCGGALLNEWDRSGKALMAFLVLFAVAGVARLISALLLARHADLPWSERPLAPIAWRELAARFFAPDKSRFLLFLLVNQISVNLAGPYFGPYFLGHMKFSYADYALIVGASYLAKILFYPYMSRFVRKVGAYRALWVSGLCVAPTPLLWFLAPAVAPICAVQVLAGVLWGSFELATTMLQFDRIAPRERLKILTAYSAMSAVAVAAGSLIAGSALALLGNKVGYPVIFTASALARAGSLLALLPRAQRRRLTLLRKAAPALSDEAAAQPVLTREAG